MLFLYYTDHKSRTMLRKPILSMMVLLPMVAAAQGIPVPPELEVSGKGSFLLDLLRDVTSGGFQLIVSLDDVDN